ncbi:hypothetical protein QL285_026932 [Trifolium repens]|nr:hypothetical protein QL285_026932 [Trifolium repens]
MVSALSLSDAWGACNTPFLILSLHPVSVEIPLFTGTYSSITGRDPSLSVNKLAFGGFGYGSGSYCTGPIMQRLSLVLSRRAASYNVHVQIKF